MQWDSLKGKDFTLQTYFAQNQMHKSKHQLGFPTKVLKNESV